MTEPFDESKLYLGALCSRGDDWNGTGRSLRRRSSRTCCDCEKEYNRRWREANLEQVRENKRRYRLLNPEKVRENKHRWYEANPEKARETQRRWYEANTESYKTYTHRRRARKAAALVVPYSGAELAAHFAQFDGCAYCGAAEQTVDHLFPLSDDLLAADALFNIVPACKRCNSSKNNRQPLSWYKSQPFYDPDRLQRIIDILGIGKP